MINNETSKFSLSIKDLETIAMLSMLSLSEVDQKKLVNDLIFVLEYVKKLFYINVKGLEEVSQVTSLANVYREDIVTNTSGVNIREKMLSNCPYKLNGYFVVPRILH